VKNIVAIVVHVVHVGTMGVVIPLGPAGKNVVHVDTVVGVVAGLKMVIDRRRWLWMLWRGGTEEGSADSSH